MLMLFLCLVFIAGSLSARIPSRREAVYRGMIPGRDSADDESFYRFFYNVTGGKIFNVSHFSHTFLQNMGLDWPDLDPEDFPPFNCSTTQTYPRRKPTSVHKLTPFDIDVVAAMGDSLTAGFGALSFTLVDLFVEYRGVSWSIGGDSVLTKHITIPNIIKRYNPQVKGYARGIAPPLIAVPWEHLNLAVSGATAYGLMKQAVEFVSKLTRDPRYDFLNDWKLLTLFIGGNDLCACCRSYLDHDVLYKPENYIKEMTKVLDYLSNTVPRLFVNIADAPDVTLLHEMKSAKCQLTHLIECKCGTVWGEKARNYTKDAVGKYHKLLHDLVVHSGRYDHRDDFAVVLQPFIDATEVPRLSDGTIDPTYWAPDCFHFSGKAHSAAAHGLWNNMLQPVGQKDKKWKVGEPYACPTAEHPYFYTNLNGDNKRVIH